MRNSVTDHDGQQLVQDEIDGSSARRLTRPLKILGVIIDQGRL